MTYEIPQELEYNEILIFGLTANQLGYALLFGVPALLAFFKLPLGVYARTAIALFPLSLAVLFMFFDFSNAIKSWKYFLSFRNALLFSPKMKEFLPIHKISDSSITIKRKGRERKIAVLKAEPINFRIKNSDERNAVIAGFQKFLDSLEHPIQIVMGTEPLNLDIYSKSLESRAEMVAELTKNPDYLAHFSAYKKHIEETIKAGSMMNRNFYIAIPEIDTIGLDIQASICRESLKNAGIESKRLSNDELTQMLAGFFNDLLEEDGEKEGKISDISEENYLHCIIAPKEIENNIDYIRVDKKYCKVISTVGYPRLVEPGFLDKIITTNGDFDISLHIEPFPIEATMVMLNKELQKQRADLYAAQLKGTLNPSLEIKYADTRTVLENLQKGTEKLFNISLYINCKSNTQDELNLITKKVESELNGLMIIPKRPLFRMGQGIKSTIPLSINELGIKRNITTKPLSAFFPFTSQFLQIDEKGVWFGLNKNDVPIIRDIFSLTNPNGLILATSGSGKSYFAKLNISRHLLNGTRVIVIDPQTEYSELCRKFNGQVINISRANLVINPLDLMGHDYAEKRLSLIDLMKVMLGELSDIQKADLDKAITLTYDRKGITNNPETWSNKPPILKDLLNELESLGRKATVIEKPTYQSLINRLSMYVDGVFSFLNRHTKFDFDNYFVCFNIGDMPKQVKPVIMFLILDYVYMKMKSDKERKLLVIDEAWSLLARTEDSSYIFEIVKTCRKFNMGLLLITQDVADLLSSEAGNAVLANSSYTLLMRQKPAVIENVSRTFHLSYAERDKLLTSGLGEGILLIENEHTELKIISSKEEHDIITTNPDEILIKEKESNKKDAIPKYEKEVSIKLDIQKGFYNKAGLTPEEIQFLLSHEYIISSHVGLGGGQRKDYLLKPRANESAQHFFLVKAIEDYIMQFTSQVELFNSVKPDIVFTAGRKEYAVEIETGTTYDSDKRKLAAKASLLSKYYPDRWFFVVTKSEYAYKYKEIGKTYTRKNIEQAIREIFRNVHSAQKPPKK